MNCKNCSHSIKEGETFCLNCGTKTEADPTINTDKKSFKGFYVMFFISSILFLIVLIINLFFMKLYINERNGMAGLFIFFCMIITAIPFMALLVLSIINIISKIRYKMKKIITPTKVKVFGLINILLVPILIITFFVVSGIKDIQNENAIKDKLNELYGDSYKILDTCSVSNTGGDYFTEYLIKLDDFEFPIIGHFELNDYSYNDNYEVLMKTKKMDYQKYLNDVFGDRTISLMSIYESESYNEIELYIVMTNKHLKNDKKLAENIEEVINYYKSQYPNYEVDVVIYFLDNINTKKAKDYYTLISSRISLCNEGFEHKFNTSKIKTLNIYISMNTPM